MHLLVVKNERGGIDRDLEPGKAPPSFDGVTVTSCLLLADWLYARLHVQHVDGKADAPRMVAAARHVTLPSALACSPSA